MANNSQTTKPSDRRQPAEKDVKPSPEKDPFAQAVQKSLNKTDWEKALKPSTTANGTERSGESSLPKSLDLSIWNKPKGTDQLALNQTREGNSKLTDRQQKSKDGEDKAKDKSKDTDYKAARENFLPHLRDRFKDNPALLKDLENRLDKMEARVLKLNATTDKGEKIDQKEQLSKWYKNQTRIAQGAENLKDKDGLGGEAIFSHSDVSEILASNIIRGENQSTVYKQGPNGTLVKEEKTGTRYEQGANNTCAAESPNRQFGVRLLGDESESTAQMLTTGQFQAFDEHGKEFTCKVDRPSMRLDREAKLIAAERRSSLNPEQYCSTRTNRRDAAGQMGDLRTGQWNNSLIGRNEIGEGGENLYIYQKRFSGAQNDTGERIAVNASNNFKTSRPGEKVVNTAEGKFLYETDKKGNPIGPVMSPDINGNTLGALKQGMMGKFGKNFGKDTTIVSDAAFGSLENATSCKNRAEMDAHFNKLQNLYGDDVLPTVATHVGNYLNSANGLGGAQGWHAWSANRDKDGNYDIAGSWGGQEEGKLTSDRLFAYMQAPPPSRLAANHPDRQRGDHVFYPDRPDPDNPSRAIRRDTSEKPDADKDKNNPKDEEKKEINARKEEEEKNRQREEQKHKQESEVKYALEASKQLEAQIASTTDANKISMLQAQKKYYDSLIRQT